MVSNGYFIVILVCVEIGIGRPILHVRIFFQIPTISVLPHSVSQHFGKLGVLIKVRITCTLFKLLRIFRNFCFSSSQFQCDFWFSTLGQSSEIYVLNNTLGWLFCRRLTDLQFDHFLRRKKKNIPRTQKKYQNCPNWARD